MIEPSIKIYDISPSVVLKIFKKADLRPFLNLLETSTYSRDLILNHKCALKRYIGHLLSLKVSDEGNLLLYRYGQNAKKQTFVEGKLEEIEKIPDCDFALFRFHTFEIEIWHESQSIVDCLVNLMKPRNISCCFLWLETLPLRSVQKLCAVISNLKAHIRHDEEKFSPGNWLTKIGPQNLRIFSTNVDYNFIDFFYEHRELTILCTGDASLAEQSMIQLCENFHNGMSMGVNSSITLSISNSRLWEFAARGAKFEALNFGIPLPEENVINSESAELHLAPRKKGNQFLVIFSRYFHSHFEKICLTATTFSSFDNLLEMIYDSVFGRFPVDLSGFAFNNGTSIIELEELFR